MVSSILAIYQNDVFYAKDSQTIIKDLTNIHVIRVPERKEKEGGVEKVLEVLCWWKQKG